MRMPGAGVVFIYSGTFMAVLLGTGGLGECGHVRSKQLVTSQLFLKPTLFCMAARTWMSLPSFAEFAELSGNIEPIEVHDFHPCGNKVLHEDLLRIVRRIDFSDCPKLGVRTEDQVHTGSGPL